jgi:integrase
MKSYKVRILKIESYEIDSGTRHRVRWRVDGHKHSQSFEGFALADNYRTKLKTAQNNGEPFNVEKPGLPDSLIKQQPSSKQASETLGAPIITWAQLAADYVDKKWKRLAAKSRETTVYALAALLPGLTDELPGRPQLQALRHAACRWSLPPANREIGVEIPEAATKTLEWLEKASIPVQDETSAEILTAALNGMMTKLDGEQYAPDVVKRRLRILTNFVKYAMSAGHLTSDPFKALDWEPPQVVVKLDPRRVPNPRQVESLLTAVSYVGGYSRARGRRLVGFFACMYYALMRPEEVIVLNIEDCDLPDEGWGRLILHRARPTAGKAWTDSGELHDDRSLKQKAAGEVRIVPIPPTLVSLLQAHVDDFGVAPDGRIFANERGGLVAASTYSRVWREARDLAFPPHRRKTALAAEPYDLRHAGISLGLSITNDPTLMAERAGNSPEILLRRYSWALDGKDAAANRAIEAALGSI